MQLCPTNHSFRTASGLLLLLFLAACGGGSDATLAPPPMQDVAVPNVVGQSQANATSAIDDAGLTVGTVTSEASDTVPAGNVISQSPAAGSMVSSGSSVDFVVSLGPASIVVPDVVGFSRTVAEDRIAAAGLAVGAVTERADSTVPAGDVISQSPDAGVLAAPGSDVDLVVSLGPANVAAPDVTGQGRAAAENAIAAAGLVVGTVTEEANASVPDGDVISQNPTGGTLVAAGSAVDLVVSLGPANVAVPNVTGQSRAAAESAIVAAGLAVGSVTEQADAAVPNVTGQTQSAAENGITAAGLTVGSVTQQNDNGVPAGSVISQNPIAGTQVTAGSAVDLVVSLGPANVAVPNVAGQTQSAAENAITAAGLTVGNVTQQNDNAVPAGNVISQSPAAGTQVTPGSAVDLVVSLGPANVAVPNVTGQTQGAAQSAITAAGLTVGNVTQQNDNAVPAGSVISQDPTAGTQVAPGSAVDLVVSLGPVSGGGFSDEFNSNSLGDWSLRHQVEGTAAQYSVLDINQSRPGFLTIVPNQTPGWFDDGDAPLVFKLLTGNFAVHTRVLADSVSSPGQAPGSNFNSAGLIARNPAGASDPENYIMLNVGRQNNLIGAGSETKTTVNSDSELLLDSASNEGDLVLCRVGNTFYSYRFLSVDSSWLQLQSYDRPDLPATLQVGMVVNAFISPADLRAEFDFVRLLPTPSNASECLP